MRDGLAVTWRRTLLKTIIFLSLPTIIEQILATLLQYVDTAMVGQLGEQATASVSITTNVTWLVNSVPGAIGTAMQVMISRASGAGDRKQVEKLSQQALFLAVVSGVILGALSIGLSPLIPVWMGAEAGIQEDASRYFFIISLPMVFRSASTILGASLRAVQNTKTPMLISAGGQWNQCGAQLSADLYRGAGSGRGSHCFCHLLHHFRNPDVRGLPPQPACFGGDGRIFPWKAVCWESAEKWEFPYWGPAWFPAWDMWYLPVWYPGWERPYLRLIPSR